jgi:hypothetical protein
MTLPQSGAAKLRCPLTSPPTFWQNYAALLLPLTHSGRTTVPSHFLAELLCPLTFWQNYSALSLSGRITLVSHFLAELRRLLTFSLTFWQNGPACPPSLPCQQLSLPHRYLSSKRMLVSGLPIGQICTEDSVTTEKQCIVQHMQYRM